MRRERDQRYPTDAFGLPEGLLAAIAGALILVGVFAFATSATAMPPAERWGALTTFALLAAGATLPGCAALYDALGRTVRRDWRALAALVAVVPALYIAYALAVRELTTAGLVSAVLFAAVPAVALGSAGQSRSPTLLDGVGLVYLGLSLWLGLLPGLTLPQQGGLVSFFTLASVPLLLLLYAARGWPGVGFTWHLSVRELRDALLAGLAAAVVAVAAWVATGGALATSPPTAGGLILGVVGTYFFTALPVELLLRGGVQNGLERALRGPMGATAAWVALTVTTALWAVPGFVTGGIRGVLYALVVGVATGWTYKRTGKVTASAVTHLVIALAVNLLTNI